MKTHLYDSYFLHLKGALDLKVSPQQLSNNTPLCLVSFFFSGKMAMISGFIFLCVLQAAISQGLGPRGPRPVPGRGDSPPLTPPPIPPPTPRPESCEGEFH